MGTTVKVRESAYLVLRENTVTENMRHPPHARVIARRVTGVEKHLSRKHNINVEIIPCTVRLDRTNLFKFPMDISRVEALPLLALQFISVQKDIIV